VNPANIRSRVLEEHPWWPPGEAGREERDDLLERLRAGEEAAFEELVHREGGRLLAAARHLLRGEEEARDAVQEAFLSAYCSLARFRGESSLSTWLHRIVINTSLMKLRARARRPETPIEDLLPRFDGEGRLASPTGSWAPDPEKAMRDRETCERVRRAIDELPEAYRTVLVLRDVEELTTQETAQVLSLTTTAVKVRLHRARLALRTLLETVFGKNATPRPLRV